MPCQTHVNNPSFCCLWNNEEEPAARWNVVWVLDSLVLLKLLQQVRLLWRHRHPTAATVTEQVAAQLECKEDGSTKGTKEADMV